MIIQQIVNGLTLGTTYSLLALGYSMIFGVLSFINFAHGDVSVFGAYIALYFGVMLKLPLVVAILLGLVVAAFLGMSLEFVGYRPLRRAPKLASVIASMGFSFVLSTLIQVLWGTRSLSMPSIIEKKSFEFGSITFNTVQIFIFVSSIVIMILLNIFVRKTKLGLAMRAISMDQEVSGLMGINVNFTISFTFALGSILGAVSAILMASYYGAIYPTMGALIGIKGFAAVVLGGAGSIPGAMIGGVIIGVLEGLAGAFFSAQVKEVTAFVVLIIVLLFKPSGIFGKEVSKQ